MSRTTFSPAGWFMTPVFLIALSGILGCDGGPEQIAFTSDRDGNIEIHLMNADGTNQINLTMNTGFDAGPVFNPGGSQAEQVVCGGYPSDQGA